LNWINIAAAVTIGLISGAVAYIIARKYPTRRILSFAIPVLVFVVLSALVKFFLIPPLHLWKSQREVERSLSQVAAFKIIAKYDLKAYEEIKREILKSLKNRESPDEVFEQARQRVAEWVPGYIPRASDAAIVRYMKAMVKEMVELSGKNPELCYQFLFPRKYGAVNVTEHLSPETQREDLAALAEVIRTAVEDPQSSPDPTPAETLLKEILSQFSLDHGEDTLLLKDPFAPGIDKAKACGLIAALYEKVLTLPEREASLVLRYMLSTKQ
jgi:hypothetical protein